MVAKNNKKAYVWAIPTQAPLTRAHLLNRGSQLLQLSLHSPGYEQPENVLLVLGMISESASIVLKTKFSRSFCVESDACVGPEFTM